MGDKALQALVIDLAERLQRCSIKQLAYTLISAPAIEQCLRLAIAEQVRRTPVPGGRLPFRARAKGVNNGNQERGIA